MTFLRNLRRSGELVSEFGLTAVVPAPKLLIMLSSMF